MRPARLIALICFTVLLVGCGQKPQQSSSDALNNYLASIIQNNPQQFCENIAGMYVYQPDGSQSPWDLDFAASVGLLAHKTLITTPDCTTVAKAYINLVRHRKLVATDKRYKSKRDQQALVDLQNALKGPQEKPVLINSHLQTIHTSGHTFTLFRYHSKWGVVPQGINSAKLLAMLDCNNQSMPNNQLSMLCS